jgi:hypothetical protein
MPVYNYPLQQKLAGIRDALENQWTVAKQQPLVKMAGAGMDAIGKAGEVFDKLYRGNTVDDPNWKSAGVPFGPKQVVYHGTSKSFDKFNPYYNNPNDLFGKMTHFAEDPRYAGSEYTGLKIIDDANNYWKAKGMGEGYPTTDPAQGLTPRIIPARLDVKNALDVSSNDPDMINWDDLDKFLRTTLRDSPDFLDAQLRGLEKLPKQMTEAMKGNRNAVGAEYINRANKIPRDLVSSKLAGNPLGLSESGFDAIKYSDNMALQSKHKPEVWAIENTALAKGLWTGEPLGISLKPRNLERLISFAKDSPSESMMLKSPIYQHIAEHPTTDYGTVVERVAARLQDKLKSLGYSGR